MDEIAARYESLPYPETVHAATHPRRVAAAGLLAGVNPPEPSAASILEIGCGCGTNLIAVARTLPKSRCLGIDLAHSHVEKARESAAGLANVTFAQCDLRKFHADEQYDYIIAHGVFSWIPEDVRTSLLHFCSANLKPEGIAYLGFNCYPGWATHEPIRRLLLQLLGPEAGSSRLGEARRLLELLAATWHLDERGRGWHEAAVMELRQHPAVMPHDLLGAENRPFYLSEFVEYIRPHGLLFLADAIEPLGTTHVLPPQLKQFVSTLHLSAIDREQLGDFARLRQHRTALVVHADARVRPPGPAIMDRLAISTELKPAPGRVPAEGEFVTPGGALIRTRDALVTDFIARLIAAGEPRPFLHLASDASAHLRHGSATPVDLNSLREVTHSMIAGGLMVADWHR